MKNFKKDYLLIGHENSFLKRDCPITSQEREHMSRILYDSTVNFIMYAMICTRPDVTYSLEVVSIYQSDSGKNHWKVVKTILKYLRNTKDSSLFMENPTLNLRSLQTSIFSQIMTIARVCWITFIS